MNTVAIRFRLIDAMKIISIFLENEYEEREKDIVRVQLEGAIQKAILKIGIYQRNFGIDMQNPELLRDVCFLGSCFLEQSTNNFRFYKAVVKACFAIVEIGTGKSVDENFVKKIMKAMSSYQCNSGVLFQTEAFYFTFKAHFRT